MKKSYTTIKTFVVLLTLVAMNMSAQLSGLYTINSGAAASSSNYTSFATFAADLNSLGVSGPVTCDVVANSGPYVEQVQFNQATGISATNSVVINGNGNTITYASSNSSQPWVILYQGADYMTINNLNVKGTGTYAFAQMLVGGADNNKFNNCTFECPANTTSSNHIPVVFSGANSNYYTASNSGNNNIFTSCTLKSGYFSMVHYGLTGSPYNSGNTFSACTLTDWYYYGVYSYYAKNLTVTGCTIERPTHNAVGFGYGCYMYYNQGFMINGNKIRNFWGASPGNSNGAYPVYAYYNPLSGVGVQQNNIQNNIFSDFNNNSYLYMVYSYYMNGFIQHNTFVMNNTSSNYTGTFYMNYAYAGGTSYPLTVRDNIYYCTQGGSGVVYGIYYPTTSGVTSNYNDFYMNRTAGTTYVAYYNGAQGTLASLQAAGSDLNSVAFDPSFISMATGNYMPSSYAMNDLGTPVGITTDIFGNTRSSTVPDIGAIEFLNTPCSGSPISNTVIAPSGTLCPGLSIPLAFANAYTLTGLQFTWQSSTVSPVGPFVAVPGGTTQALNTPTLPVTTYYNAVVTCTNGGGTTTASTGTVMIAGTTTNTAPYYEGFEGITGPNKLPNCSWLASGSSCNTYTSSNTQNRIARTGTKFASFYYSPGTASTFYTNGIYLNAGVTYSASVWYTTEYYGYTNWTDLSILLCPQQTVSASNTVIASSSGAAVSPAYKSLSNTFTVATSGLYYVGVRGTSNGNCCGYYLSWDDLAIEIPCSLNPASVSVNTPSTTVCLGSQITLSASGAGSYVWSTGATTSSIAVTPNGNTNYVVTGVNAATGCSATASQNIIVNPTPIVSVLAASPAVCKGNSVNLTAFGASSYNWSTGGNTSQITVSPTVTTTYSVIGINSYGCQSNATQVITVNSLPNIVAASANNQICVGESMTLTATGAVTYTWSSISNLIVGNNVVVNPNVSTNYVVSGTDANGCINTSSLSLAVSPCTGLNEITTASGIKVYPNPSNGDFSVAFTNDAAKSVVVSDVTGRIVLTNTTSGKNINVNISNLSNGVYYVKIQSNNTTEVVKVVKQ